MFQAVVTKVSKLCAAVHVRDLDLLLSAAGGRRKGGGGEAGHLHLITATSASCLLRLRCAGCFGTVSCLTNNDVLSHYYWSFRHLMLKSLFSGKLSKLLQSTEAYCASFAGFYIFKPSGACWRKWKHVLKGFERSQGNIDVQLPKSHQ